MGSTRETPLHSRDAAYPPEAACAIRRRQRGGYL